MRDEKTRREEVELLVTLKARLGSAWDRGASPTPAQTRLAGAQLARARIFWAVLAAVILGLYLLLLPPFLTQLQTVCSGPRCALGQPGPAGAAALRQLGISVGAYAALSFAISVLSTLVSFVVVGLILWRRSDDWMALLVAIAVLAAGTMLTAYAVEAGHSPLRPVALALAVLDNTLQLLGLALFPSGRFVPRWIRWLPICWLAVGAVLGASYLLTGVIAFTLQNALWLVALACALGAQVFRYRFVSDTRGRQQTAWVVYGAAITILIATTVDGLTFIFPALGRPGSMYILTSGPIYALANLVFPITLAIAILRHRLYDIDLIINRTLVYGIVTGALALVYVASVVILQTAFHALTGQGSPLAVVASTLVIAGLFQPIRSRTQATVDRRFFRSKYDAVRTLEAFRSTLRAEVDLEQLSERLVAVVEEAMQPVHVSLWLRNHRPNNTEAIPPREE